VNARVRQILWFVGLWCAGVATAMLAAELFRWLIA
jgi:hypothetical protein